MSTYNTAMVTGPIQDGYLLPSGYAAFSQLTLGTVIYTHIVFQSPTDTSNVLALNTTVSISPQSTGNAITVQQVSDVTVRLVAPVTQRAGDILLLVNGSAVGIYQFSSNAWAYRGKAVVTQLQSSTVSSGLSSGLLNNLAFTGLTAQVIKVDILPDELLPYKVYVDRVTGIIYFPYVNAAAYQFPFSVASVHNPTLSSTLLDDQIIVISPAGNAQTSTLPMSTNYIFFTYTALTAVSPRQPITIYSSNLAIIAQNTMLPTALSTDYSMIAGLTDTAYQLASGYYRGGNNTWDVLVSDHGFINSTLIRQITPTSIYPSALVDIMVSKVNSNTAKSDIFVYIGKETSVQGTDIMFKVPIISFETRRLTNLRLAAGEAVFFSASASLHYIYRYTMLARSF